MRPALNSQDLLAWNTYSLRLRYCLSVTPYEALSALPRVPGSGKICIPYSSQQCSLTLLAPLLRWRWSVCLILLLFMSVSHLLNGELFKGKD